MPYIVTETVPSNVYGAGGLKTANVPHIVSRRAVATLDEAWDKLPPGIPDTTLARERFALEEHGRCSISTETEVIELERVALIDLTGQARPVAERMTTRQILDAEPEIIAAYNAAQGD